MKRLMILLVASLTMCVTPVLAEDSQNTNMQILIDKVKADKKLLIAGNMDLTEKEAKDFWPIYESYQKELGQFNSRLGKLINEYADAYNKGTVPEDVAQNLMDEALKTEGAEVKMRHEYAEKLTKVIPATKVARYLQMENKIRAAIKYELAANIPLIY